LRLARFLVGCLLAALLLWWLLRGINPGTFWVQLQSQAQALPMWLWLAAPLGLFASYGLRAARVRSELGQVRPVSWASAWQVTLVHNAAVNLLPMRGGEFAYPYLVHKKLGVAPAESVASLVWMRLQDLLVLTTLGLMLFLPVAQIFRAAAAIFFIVFAAWLIRILRRRAATWQAASAANAGAGWRAWIRRLLLPVLAALADSARHSRASWAYCVANWGLKLLVIGGILQAAGGLSGLAGVQGALGGELAALLPIQGPSGLGTYEAGVWAGVAVAQPPPLALPVAALLAHGIIFATALLAGLVAGVQMWLTHNLAPATQKSPE
jgi:Lysylphosphatidylglycerol synthase TM region